MGFNFGSFAAGFADREIERADKAREDAMALAKSTLNYRAERAMENRRKRETRINEEIRLAKNLMNNYNFTMDQVGALIGQGELQSVYNAMQEYSVGAKKGMEMPDPSVMVKLAEEKPTDIETIEEYVETLYKRPAVAPTAMKEYGYNQKSGGLFPMDTGREAREYSRQFAGQLGMSLDELTQEAFAGPLTPTGAPEAELDLTGLRTQLPPSGDDEFTSQGGLNIVRRNVERLGVTNLKVGAVLTDNGTYDYRPISDRENQAKARYVQHALAGSEQMYLELIAEGKTPREATQRVIEASATSDGLYELAQKGSGGQYKSAYSFGEVDPQIKTLSESLEAQGLTTKEEKLNWLNSKETRNNWIDEMTQDPSISASEAIEKFEELLSKAIEAIEQEYGNVVAEPKEEKEEEGAGFVDQMSNLVDDLMGEDTPASDQEDEEDNSSVYGGQSKESYYGIGN